jgi:surfeit locus 1 family protein
MRPRTVAFCTFAVVAATIFVRFGFWQVSRLHERQARNATIVQAQRGTPTPLASLPADTGAAHYRPTLVRGRFDYEHELVLAGRTHQGSPGVELLTPVRMAGGDTAILVDRGWVYSPDAGSVDRTKWRESDSANVTGYVELYAPDAGTTRSVLDNRIVRRVSRSEIAPRLPYPVAPWYMIQTGDTADARHPARREMPALDEGPHRGYAVQWFSFAMIALVGAVFVVLRERQDLGTDGTTQRTQR